jgi:hypothetical protein
VVDAEDPGLVEDAVDGLVEFPADRRSVPKGFSAITRALSARPVSPSMVMVAAVASGGIARWNRRRGCPPMASSAARTASTRGLGSFWSAAPKDRAASNDDHAFPDGFSVP